MVFNFFKKQNEEKMYNEIREHLIKRGYKPLPITKINYSFDCKKTKKSNFPFSKANELRPYPYTITITYKKASKEQTESKEQYKIAA